MPHQFSLLLTATANCSQVDNYNELPICWNLQPATHMLVSTANNLLVDSYDKLFACCLQQPVTQLLTATN